MVGDDVIQPDFSEEDWRARTDEEINSTFKYFDENGVEKPFTEMLAKWESERCPDCERIGAEKYTNYLCPLHKLPIHPLQNTLLEDADISVLDGMLASENAGGERVYGPPNPHMRYKSMIIGGYDEVVFTNQEIRAAIDRRTKQGLRRETPRQKYERLSRLPYMKTQRDARAMIFITEAEERWLQSNEAEMVRRGWI